MAPPLRHNQYSYHDHPEPDAVDGGLGTLFDSHVVTSLTTYYFPYFLLFSIYALDSDSDQMTLRVINLKIIPPNTNDGQRCISHYDIENQHWDILLVNVKIRID